jgi:lysozyme
MVGLVPALMYLDLLRHQLPIDEGRKPRPYPDTVGKWTVGIGHNLSDSDLPPEVIDLLFEHDLRDAEKVARYLLPDFDNLSDVRKAVVCNMAFNLGMKLAEFHQFLLAVHEERWVDAAIAMLDSHWAVQVGDRAKRLAESMRTDRA